MDSEPRTRADKESWVELTLNEYYNCKNKNIFLIKKINKMIKYIFVLFLFQLNSANVSQLSMIFTSNLNVLDWEY